MTYEEAMMAMRHGAPVRRKGQEHFYYMNNQNRIVKAEVFIGKLFEYTKTNLSNRDLLAEDWEVVE